MSRVVRLHSDDAPAVLSRETEDRFRSIRYGCGMHTSWSRMLWILGAVTAIGLGINGLAILVPTALANGWSGTISTRVAGGEDDNYRYHNWTRPVVEDFGIILGLIIGGIGVIGFVRLVAKGAAQWQELENDSDADW
jgi:hypothetical protein